MAIDLENLSQDELERLAIAARRKAEEKKAAEKTAAAGEAKQIKGEQMQKDRTGDYVPDDYKDARLLNYDDLFRAWEKYLRFQVGGSDQDQSPPHPLSEGLMK